MKPATINSVPELDRLLPGRFEVVAEVMRSGARLDLVRLERGEGGITAASRENPNHGAVPFGDLLTFCREKGAAVVLNTDFLAQQKLRAQYNQTS